MGHRGDERRMVQQGSFIVRGFDREPKAPSTDPRAMLTRMLDGFSSDNSFSPIAPPTRHPVAGHDPGECPAWAEYDRATGSRVDWQMTNLISNSGPLYMSEPIQPAV